MNALHRLILGVALALAANSASALNCKQMVGTWKITYKLVTDWTDTVVIHGVSGSRVDAEDEFGDPLTAFCKKGVVFAVSGDSDFIVNSWYFTDTFGRIASVFSTDSIFDLELLSDVDEATKVEKAGGAQPAARMSVDDAAAARKAKAEAQKAELLQLQQAR